MKSDDVWKVKLKETVSGIRAAEMRLPGHNQSEDGCSGTDHILRESPADLPGRPVPDEPSGDRWLQPAPLAVLSLR